ncbi:hypothetical protein S7335_3399 [Synechococcus sp. PCC 7335]|nr:hypothetical protein S7335_3399 [Synechococcus sp. PCC 7335]
MDAYSKRLSALVSHFSFEHKGFALFTLWKRPKEKWRLLYI